ncbi:MAG: preprotein translocase subunit YajC [Eubacteriales bacterium]|nr:preprotein translocase subunit YajC [Eubacteriales bacterium]
MNFPLFLQQAGNPYFSMILMVVMLGGFWFLLMRPQRKREKKLREDLQAMKVGDRIMTIGGIVGRVMNINADEVTVSTSAANTLMTFKMSAISQVLKDNEEVKSTVEKG